MHRLSFRASALERSSLKIKCISLDYTNSELADRIDLWRKPEEIQPRLDSGEIIECLPIHTCNRTELYLVLPDSGSFPDSLYVKNARFYSGSAVVEHLVRVLLGLESMACGESFVVSQVKKDYFTYRNLCGKVLNHIVQKAFNLASGLRSKYHPGRAPSIPWLMVQAVKEHPSWPSTEILILGAGEMGRETAKVLKAMKAPFSISNRSTNTGLDLADQTGAEWIPWDKWRETLSEKDVVILATSSETPLIDVSLCSEKTWIVDMGASPQATGAGIKIITVDDLKKTTRFLLSDYRSQLVQLEDKTSDAAQILWNEVISMKSDHYKGQVMARIDKIVSQRASQTAHRTKASEEILTQMGNSIVKAILSPVWDIEGHDGIKIWRALAGEMNDDS